MELKIEYLPIKALKPYEKNTRKHQKKDVDNIAKSIEKYGMLDPIGIWKGNIIIEGHGRMMACKQLGMTEVPCVRLDHLTDEQRREYAIAHNATAELSMWDLDILPDELADLDLDDFDFDFGIEDEEEETEIVEDEAPEVDEDTEPIAKLGDIWQLGRHRLMCGDSTDKSTVELLMDGKKADMVFTDPPYGMNLDTDYSKMPGTKTHYRKVIGDEKEFDMTKVFENIKSPVWYVWGADYLYKTIPNFDEGVYIVWSKRMSDEENKVFGSAYELCWTFPKRKKEVWFVRGINQSSERLGEHPTQKPTELCIRALKQNENAKNIVDFFGGSGSTLIACENYGRTCYMMELDPKYCDVIIKRWETLTGEKAVLIND